MKTGILLAGRVFLVAMLSLVLASPVFAGDAQDNDKKDVAKTFSTLKNLDKEKAKSLNEKELNKVTGGGRHGFDARALVGLPKGLPLANDVTNSTPNGPGGVPAN